MSTTVETADGFSVTSTTESAESMLAVLDEPKEGTERRARVIQDKGKAVKPESEDVGDLSDAASTLGKKGGQAAAEKRAADAKAKAAEEKKAAKEAKGAEKGPDEDPEPEPEAAAAEETDAEKKAAAEKRKGDPRHDSQARIAELARERKDAVERAERAERELAEARRQRLAQAPEQRPEPQRETRPAAEADDPEPKLEDFTEIGDYTRAVAAHATRQTIKAHEQEQSAQREVQAREQAVRGHVDAFKGRLAGVVVSDPDHGAKMAEFTSTVDPRLLELRPSFMVAPHEKQPIHQLADEIVVGSHPREVLQYLTAHPDEFQRIAALRTIPEVIRAMAIVGHNARAAVAGATSSEREPSRAKPPVQALTGSPNAASLEPDPDKGSLDDHIRFYSKKR